MTIEAQVPDGRIFEFPDGTDPAVIKRTIQKYTGQTDGPGPQSGFLPAAKAGLLGLKGDITGLAGRMGLMGLPEAEAARAKYKEEAEQTFKPTETWGEAPLTKLAELAGGSAPYMAAPLIAGAAPVLAAPATAAGVPATILGMSASGLGMGLAGLTSAAQFTGSNLSRQVDEGKKLGDTNLGYAAAAAVPQAALDIVGFKMIPGIRQMFSAAGREVSTETAKAIAEKGLANVIKDYGVHGVKAMGAEGATEAAQQVFERLQAGLSLTDKQAQDEYLENFIGGAVLGGALSPVGRRMERGAAFRQQEVDAAKAQADARKSQAEEQQAKLSDPQYLSELNQRWQDGQAKHKAFEEQLKALPNRGATPEQKLQRAEVGAAFQKFKEDEFAPLLKEVTPVRSKLEDVRKQEAAAALQKQEQDRIAALSPEEFAAEQAAKAAPTSTAPTVSAAAAPAAENPYPDYPAPAVAYAAQQVQLAKAHLTGEQADGTKTAPLAPAAGGRVRPTDFADYVMADPQQARAWLGQTADIPGLSPTLSQQVRAEVARRIERADAAAEAALRLKAAASTPAQTTLGAEAEEHAALEQTAQEQAKLDAEAEAERKRAAVVVPEINALRKLGENQWKADPVAEVVAAGQKAEKTAPERADTAAMQIHANELADTSAQKTRQEIAQGTFDPMKPSAPVLTGGQQELPLGADAPVLRRAPNDQPTVDANGRPILNLRSYKPEAPQLEVTHARLKERLAQLLANPNLSSAAYKLLRRIETVLPSTDTALSTTRTGPGARDTASSSFYQLVDEQLRRLEQGSAPEGMRDAAAPREKNEQLLQAFPTEATRAATTGSPNDVLTRDSLGRPLTDSAERRASRDEETYPNQPTERDLSGVPVEKRVSGFGPDTLLHKRGDDAARDATAKPLSLQGELEEHLRLMEQGREEQAPTQGALFPAVEKERGFVKEDPAAWQRFVNSPFVRSLRKALRRDAEVLAKAEKLPELHKRVEALQAQLTDLMQKRAEQNSARQTLQEVGHISNDARTLSGELLSKYVQLGELRTRIEELTNQRNDLLGEAARMVQEGHLTHYQDTLLAQLNYTLSALRAHQTELTETAASLKSLDTQIKRAQAATKLSRNVPSADVEAALKLQLRAAATEVGEVQRAHSEATALADVEAARKRRQAAAVAAKEAANAVDAQQRTQVATAPRRERGIAFTPRESRDESRAVDGLQAGSASESMALNEALRMSGKSKFTIDAKTAEQLRKNPYKVLGGVRSLITKLEARIQKGEAKSREARSSLLRDRQARLQALEDRYKAEPSSAARAQLFPHLERFRDFVRNAEARERAKPKPMWIGAKQQMRQLAQAYSKLDVLEEMERSGQFEQGADRAARQATRPIPTSDEQARAAAKEAAKVAGAPKLSSTEQRQSDIVKARKAQNTQYSLTSHTADLQNAGGEQARKDALVGVQEQADKEQQAIKEAKAERAAYVAQLRDKEASGRVLNPFEQAVLDRPELSDESYLQKAREDGKLEPVNKTPTQFAEPVQAPEAKTRAEKQAEAAAAIEESKANTVLTPEELTAREEKAKQDWATKEKAAADKEAKAAAANAKVAATKADIAKGTPSEIIGTEMGAPKGEEKPMFRTHERAAGMQAKAAQSEADRLVKNWTNAPAIEAVQAETDLPQQVQDRIQREGVAGKVPGVYDPVSNKVWLVADNLDGTQDVGLTIAHEVAGHYGLRGVLGEEYAGTMNRFYTGNKQVREAADRIMGQQKDLTRAEATEEALVDMAQHPETQPPGLMRRIYNYLRSVMARATKLFNPAAVTDEDVQSLLANAKRFVEEGGDGPKGGQTETPLFRTKAPKGFEKADALARDVIAGERGVFRKAWDSVWGKTGLAAYTQFFNAAGPSEAFAAKMSDKHAATQMLYHVQQARRSMNATSVALGNGVHNVIEGVNTKGEKYHMSVSQKGANMREVMSQLKPASTVLKDRTTALFSLYGVAQRAKSVGLNKLNYDVNVVTQAKIDAAMAEINADATVKAAFENAWDTYQQYNKDLLTFLKQAGVINAAQYNTLTKNNDYIPYYRDRKGNPELVIGSETPVRIGNIKDAENFKKLVGSDFQIVDITHSAVANTHTILDMALKNLAAKSTSYELKKAGAAVITHKKLTGPDVVEFFDNGHEMYAKVDSEKFGIPSDLFVKSMAGIPTMLPAVSRILNYPATLLRKSVTMNPLYWGVRQPLRDTLNAAFTSGSNAIPLYDAAKALGNMPTTEFLRNANVLGGQVFTGTNEDMVRIMQDISGRTNMMAKLAQLEALSMKADATTRVTQYDSYIAQGLDPMEATFKTIDSMDFNKRGLSPSMHVISSMIPFFNAQVQSLDVLYKAMTGTGHLNDRLGVQQKFWTRASLLAGTTLMYAAAMQDDEAYKNATPEERAAYWFVRVPGLNEPVRIPVPFEVGYLFKALPEMLYRASQDKLEDKEAKDVLKYVFMNMTPSITPQSIKPLVEAGTDHSFFTGRPIQTKAEQNMAPGTQLRDTTSGASQTLGQAFGVSPILLDHVIQGYTSSLGIALVRAATGVGEPGTEGFAPEKENSQKALVGTLFQRNDGQGVLNAISDTLHDYIAAKATYDKYVKDGRLDMAEKYLKEHTGEIALADIGSEFKRDMKELQEYKQAIISSKDLTPAEKRERLIDLGRKKIEIAGYYQKATREAQRQVGLR